jgi:dTDP-4-dehydrorhamnose reductase
MLGTEIRLKLQESGLAFISSDIDVDITNYERLKEFLGTKKPEWIINASAYTAVDKAEDEKEPAFAVNSSGVANLAKLAKECGSKLLHISTDYVFSGEKDGEYYEDDTTKPTGVYGASKLYGENQIIQNYDKYLIIRVSWLIGFYGKNFLYTMLRLMNDKPEIKVVNDQWGSPTFANELSDFILSIVKSDSTKFGTYHYSCTGKTTWYDFAVAICDLAYEYGIINKKPKIIPINTEEYPTKAHRPENSYLSKDKIMTEFNFKPSHWRISLKNFMTFLVDNKDRCGFF